MDLTIDTSSEIPVYDQIVIGVEKHVLSGSLAAGAILPPIRQLANDLDVNPNTVAKAYKILEERRITKTAGRKGTFVRDGADKNFQKSIEDESFDKIQTLVTRLMGKGASKHVLRRAFKSAMEQAEGSLT